MLFCLYFSHYKYIFHVIKSKATLQKLIYKPISKSVQRQLQGSLQGNLALLSLALLDSSLVTYIIEFKNKRVGSYAARSYFLGAPLNPITSRVQDSDIFPGGPEDSQLYFGLSN